MKKIVYSLFFVLVISVHARAQSCNASGASQCTASGTLLIPGLSPTSDLLPAFENGIPSTTVIQFKNFNQVLFSGLTLTVQSLRIDSIENLPPGLCWATDKANNTYSNQESGCIKINGTPCGTPGQYKLRIIVTVNVGITQQVNAESAGLKYFVRLGNYGDVEPAVDTLQTIPLYTVGYSPTANCSPVICSSFTFSNSSSGNTSCATPNGSLSVAASGGANPYTYSLGGSSNTSGNFTALSGGSYDVIAVDDNGCRDTTTVVVTSTVPVVTVNTVTVTPLTSCIGDNGAFTVSASGGTSPYTFSSSAGNGSNGSYTQLGDAVYTVTATDANQCSGSATVTVADNTPVITVSASSTTPQTSCTGSNGAVTASASGGTSPYSYDNGTSTNATGIFTGLASGTYTITVTDVNGCVGTLSGTIASNVPSVSVGVTHVNASTAQATDGSATATGSGGTAPYSYNWSNSQSSATATGLAVGNYSVTATDANGCSASGTVVVSFNSGINSLVSEITALNIFPNPATDNVTVSAQFTAAKPITVAIYNVMGEKVLVKNEGTTDKISANFNLKGMAKGTYFVKISTGEKLAAYPIVIE
ncbi:MAG: T9SS type A sorting domain-containing protein [Chitinophagales bacterium]